MDMGYLDVARGQTMLLALVEQNENLAGRAAWCHWKEREAKANAGH